MRHRMLAWLSCSLIPAAPLSAQVELRGCDVAVAIAPTGLAVTASLDLAGVAAGDLRLTLTPAMKVEDVQVAGQAAQFTVGDGEIAIQVPVAGRCTIAVRCSGAPAERFSAARGGFVRSAIGPDLAYVRGQVPWYPRLRDVPAPHRIVVDAPAGWQVRTAGAFAAPVAKGERAIWTFTTAGPIDRAGLAAGPFAVVADGPCDALVAAGHERGAAATLALARAAFARHVEAYGALPRQRFSLVEMPEAFGHGSGYSECGYMLLGPGAFADDPPAAWVPAFLAHETAHQWWGNDGLFGDFASEALAEYSALLCVRGASGDEAAARMRASALAAVGKAIADGKGIALATIRGYGGDLDAGTYRVHAYDKGMLLLAAVGDAVGERAMQGCLRRFLGDARKQRVGWAELRAALCGLGGKAKKVVEQWEGPDLPAEAKAQLAAQPDAKAGFERGMKVANSPGEGDAKVLQAAIADLRAACAAATLGDGERAAARSGLGRCLFRLGERDAAEKELKQALAEGAGGPFHRGWCELRLGNLDDLRGRREEACAHYRAVVDNPRASKTTIGMAKKFLEHAYRGFDADG